MGEGAREKSFDALCEKFPEGTEEALKLMEKKVKTCSKTYFNATLVGCILAMLTTVGIMLVFNHGQPALLYLVPAVCLAVILTSAVRGEFSLMWNHVEDKYIGKTEEEA